VLETLALAHRWGAFPDDPQSQEQIAEIAGDLVRVVDALRSDYQRLGPIRSAREQTYLDLIGDGCHAIRGLRESLVAFFRP
jgi:hypothetical protein